MSEVTQKQFAALMEVWARGWLAKSGRDWSSPSKRVHSYLTINSLVNRRLLSPHRR